MKQFFTLILMLITLLTFTQKVTAFAPLLESETASMVNCSMSMGLHESKMEMGKTDCGNDEMLHTTDCQIVCDFMNMVSVFYFIDHEHIVNQPELQLTYHTGSSAAPSYFPESLYRPPFLS